MFRIGPTTRQDLRRLYIFDIFLGDLENGRNEPRSNIHSLTPYESLAFLRLVPVLQRFGHIWQNVYNNVRQQTRLTASHSKSQCICTHQKWPNICRQSGKYQAFIRWSQICCSYISLQQWSWPHISQHILSMNLPMSTVYPTRTPGNLFAQIWPIQLCMTGLHLERLPFWLLENLEAEILGDVMERRSFSDESWIASEVFIESFSQFLTISCSFFT